MANTWDFETRSIHSGFDQDKGTGATALPIYESAAFAYDSAEDLEAAFQGRKFGHIYSRIANPTVTAFENRVNALENGLGAIATASGMAAIATAVYTLAQAGDEIVSGKSLFGGTFQLFNEIFGNSGIKVVYVESTATEAYRRAISPRTKLVFLETIGNPKLDIPDIGAIAAVAREQGVPLVVDSTLSTPYLFAAKRFGVDLVIHSTSKYISGSGNTIGGILVDLGNFDWRHCRTGAVAALTKQAGEYAFLARARRQVLQNTGSCLSPFNAYLQNLGLETLALRMSKHCTNAVGLVEYFQAQPQVVSVNYPGLPGHPDHAVAAAQFHGGYGGLITLRLGTRERCFRMINRLKMVKCLANVGDAKTLIIHPASTIYHNCSAAEQEAAGVYPDLVRISVGIESLRDIINDFDQALAKE
ncbi:O-acetylhomoserine (thiol)-lyase [Hydrogenispora ethanolica]|jgi:O-acetylhomoserine (thiol)-lyase|uniref:homocysteine desulfhydrase n=1 Tax=Hydrogenispora ethanolica TaxID=1082276 RepID=A0A4R1R905_HYDET|nr:aminotransferase class I/II-fold pyridoxal phosphate-dependent enzyme [Hydrogenispora ethanolica]TCL62165.1 O-acetylhomoserine (thiol)-lyase [Hydrogenispora ethanolica]